MERVSPGIDLNEARTVPIIRRMIVTATVYAVRFLFWSFAGLSRVVRFITAIFKVEVGSCFAFISFEANNDMVDGIDFCELILVKCGIECD